MLLINLCSGPRTLPLPSGVPEMLALLLLVKAATAAIIVTLASLAGKLLVLDTETVSALAARAAVMIGRLAMIGPLSVRLRGPSNVHLPTTVIACETMTAMPLVVSAAEALLNNGADGACLPFHPEIITARTEAPEHPRLWTLGLKLLPMTVARYQVAQNLGFFALVTIHGDHYYFVRAS